MPSPRMFYSAVHRSRRGAAMSSRRAAALLRRGVEPAALLVVLQRRRDVVELAREQLVEVVDGELDAVVGDAALGEVVGADLLRPLARADLRAPVGGQLGLLLGELLLVEPRAQDPHRAL